MSRKVDRTHSILIVAILAGVIAVLNVRVLSQHQFGRGLVSIAGHDAVSGEVLIRFVDGSSDDDRLQIAGEIDADEIESVARDLKRVRSRSFDSIALLNYLRTRRSIAYAEPNYIVQAVVTANDPRFPTMWGLLNNGQTINGNPGVAGADIHVTKAWNVTVGSRKNIVAVLDSGVDYTHPDLAANIWMAPSAFTVTIGGRTVSCAAGTHGFNAIAKSCDPRDDMNHGTHVAGTIGAYGDNLLGVTGVNWRSSIMALKFLDSSGTGTVADAISSIEFAIQARKTFQSAANVRVLSNSWTGGGFSQALLDEINKANTSGMLFVAAAGNDSRNISSTPTYPASYKAPNVVSVAATTNSDHLANFSNYGSSVHLGAPGVDILSTTIGKTYGFSSGTSMATPHVSGAAALILSKCALDTAGVKATILNHVDHVGALTGWVSTGGRLNVDRAVRSCAIPSAPGGLQAASGPGAGQISLIWSAASRAATYNVKRSWTAGGPYTTVATSLTARSFIYSGTTGRRYFFVVSATNAAGEGSNSNEVTALGK
jgi:thermitase